MSFRKSLGWWVITLIYIALCLSLIPSIEDYFSPFIFHVRQGSP